MARVTVEDCMQYIPNRFDLVLVAAERARKLDRGADQTSLENKARGKEKNTVVALREIAEGVSINSQSKIEESQEENNDQESDQELV